MQNISDQHMLMKKLIKVILSAQCSHLSGIWERWLVGSLPPVLERLIPGLEPTTHHLDKGNLPSLQVKFIHELLSNKFPGYRTSKSFIFAIGLLKCLGRWERLSGMLWWQLRCHNGMQTFFCPLAQKAWYLSSSLSLL